MLKAPHCGDCQDVCAEGHSCQKLIELPICLFTIQSLLLRTVLYMLHAKHDPDKYKTGCIVMLDLLDVGPPGKNTYFQNVNFFIS